MGAAFSIGDSVLPTVALRPGKAVVNVSYLVSEFFRFVFVGFGVTATISGSVLLPPQITQALFSIPEGSGNVDIDAEFVDRRLRLFELVQPSP